MTKFVLDKYALDSKKSEAKAKIVGSLGSNASISGDQIEVPSYDASKPAFLTKKENGVSESPTQYRFEPDFSPAPPTTVCCENLTRHRHQLDLRKKELICVNPTSSRLF
jgi:hypothetical protein